MASEYQIISGNGGLPRMRLVAPDGARAEVYLHGGQLTSWIPASGGERFFISPKAVFSHQTAIRGGIPVLFPQFSVFGPLRKHGFARLQNWEALGAWENCGNIAAIFQLKDNESTLNEWCHAFLLELLVVVGGNQLSLTLSVTNTSNGVFNFTTGLHSYLNVEDLDQVKLKGLSGCAYTDHTDKDRQKLQTDELLRIDGEVDRIYTNPRPQLTVQDNRSQIKIRRRGFSDTVVWNPGSKGSAVIADLEPESYRSFLCIEAATIAKPIRLSSDESWQGTQIFTI